MEDREDFSSFPGGDYSRESQAAGIGALCVSSARGLWPTAPGRVHVVEDWPLGGV